VLDEAVLAGLRELAAMSSDGRERMRDLVEIFLEDAQARTLGLARAVGEGDTATVEALAHSLAGSSANLAAHIIAQICKQMETQASAGVIADGAAQVQRLEVALADAGDALRAEFSR
jgi:HPt (histidine-containing phosphotransfer) domain-containing protein